jgi:hypothetical protein
MLLGVLVCAGCATQAPPVESGIDSEAAALVRDMSDTLAAAQTMRIKTEERHEFVDRRGEVHTRAMRRDAVMQRPGTLRFRSYRERLWREGLFANGALTIVDHSEQAVSTATVPANMNETIDYLSEQLRIPMPISDFLYDPPYEALITPDTRGTHVGYEKVRGRQCHRLDFANAAVDWKVWIRTEGPPVPRKFEITYKRAFGSPTTTILFHAWELNPSLPATAFSLTAPESYERVRFRSMDLTGTASE